MIHCCDLFCRINIPNSNRVFPIVCAPLSGGKLATIVFKRNMINQVFVFKAQNLFTVACVPDLECFVPTCRRQPCSVWTKGDLNNNIIVPDEFDSGALLKEAIRVKSSPSLRAVLWIDRLEADATSLMASWSSHFGDGQSHSWKRAVYAELLQFAGLEGAADISAHLKKLSSPELRTQQWLDSLQRTDSPRAGPSERR